MAKTISLTQLGVLVKNGNPVIVDIREPREFSRYHLPGAKNVPYQNLVRSPERFIKKGEPIYIICGHGSVSYRAAQILRSFGYEAISISDGYESKAFRR